MRVMKYYCDKCEKEVDYKGLAEISIVVRNSETTKVGSRYPRENISICGECLTEIGFDKERNSIPNPFEMIKRLSKVFWQPKDKE